MENKDIFSVSEFETGRTPLLKYDIKVKEGIRPRKQTHRWLNPNQQDIADKIIEEWITKKFVTKIDPNNSDQSGLWISPLVLARKKGPENANWRLCVDYRLLNQLTADEVCILPHLNNIMAKLGKATIFSTLDLSQGYMNIELTENSKPLTGFTNGTDIFIFNVLPFGLKAAPSQFQAFMDGIFKELINSSIIVFIDDLLIYTETFEQHMEVLKFVFSRLRYANLKLKLRKCIFGSREANFLGHIVSKGGIFTDPDKIQAMLKIARPSNIKELQHFIGVINFYRRFLPRLSETQSSLYTLLKKDQAFNWTEDQEHAFQQTKDLLASNNFLGHPDWNKPFVLSTDASSKAAAAVLEQFLDDPKQPRPIAYWSKAFNQTQRNYSASDRELFAMYHAIKNFRSYLLGTKFVVVTDCQALTFILGNRLTNPKWIRTSLKLAEYDFKILYRPGKQNIPADALSRLIAEEKGETPSSEEEAPLAAIMQHLSKEEIPLLAIFQNLRESRGLFINHVHLKKQQSLNDEDFKETRSTYRAKYAEANPEEDELDSDEDFADCNTFAENLEAKSNGIVNKPRPIGFLDNSKDSRNEPGKQKKVHWDTALEHHYFHDEEADLEDINNISGLKPLEQQTQDVVYIPDTNETEISPSNFSILQQQDRKLTKWITKAKTGTHPKYFIEDGLLKVALHDFQALIVVPATLEDKLIMSCHKGILGFAHLGVTGTIKRILERYYIAHIVSKVRSVIKTCATCQRLKREYESTEVPMLRQPLVTQPFSKVAIDFAGPFKESTQGNKYILNCIDIHSRYIVLIPTADQKARTFVKHFIEHWISHFGIPDVLLSDNGPAFAAKVAGRFYRLYGIKKDFSLPLRPQSNGIVERSNQVVTHQLRAATSKSKLRFWDHKLPTVQFNINNTVSNATGYKPSQLTFGIHIKVPYHMLVTDDEKQPKTLHDACDEWYGNLQKLRALTVKHQIRQQNSYISSKEVVDSLAKFQLGNLVCLHREPKHKLQPEWIGPYIVEYLKRNSATIKAQNIENAPIRKAHISQLKHYYELVNENGEDLVVDNPESPVADLIDFNHDFSTDKEQELDDDLKGRERDDDDNESDDEEFAEKEYEVHEILNKRLYRNRVQYLVWWTDYSEEDATWEPIENLDSCKEKIAEFEQRQAKKREANRKRRTGKAHDTQSTL